MGLVLILLAEACVSSSKGSGVETDTEDADSGGDSDTLESLTRRSTLRRDSFHPR